MGVAKDGANCGRVGLEEADFLVHFDIITSEGVNLSLEDND